LHRLASLAHAAFYVLLLAALSGWLLVSAAIMAIPTRFFGLFVIPNLVGADASLSDDMASWHHVVSRLIMGLLILHVAAALKHHYVDRDDVLARMLPRLLNFSRRHQIAVKVVPPVTKPRWFRIRH
jgi:cytochrome b561